MPQSGFGQPPEPIIDPHFPSRLYAFIWRNWELANADRIANVLRTTGAVVLKIGTSMGLPKKPLISGDQLARIYITVIRQNWHILPEEQIVELLGWTTARFQFTLKEDDFLGIKLGRKPRCGDLLYGPPSAADKARAREIRATVGELFGDSIRQPGEERFHFVKLLSDGSKQPLRDDAAKPLPDEVDLTQGWGLIVRSRSGAAGATTPVVSGNRPWARSWRRARRPTTSRWQSIPRSLFGFAFRVMK